MTTYAISKLCYRLDREPRLRQALHQDPHAALRRLHLDADEVEDLLAGDVAGLYRRGVHPILLSRLARWGVLGVTDASYSAAIRSAAQATGRDT